MTNAPRMTPAEFAEKWLQSERRERASSQEHFIDLCRMLGVSTPNDPGSSPDWYAFEKPVTKTLGSDGASWRRQRRAGVIWLLAGGGVVTVAKLPDKVDTLVLLLGAPGPTGRPAAAIRGVTRLQKLLFLIQQHRDFIAATTYSFQPYRFGPFSRDLYDSLAFLVEHGFASISGMPAVDHYAAVEEEQFDEETAPDLVAGREKTYNLTPKGRRLAEALADRTEPRILKTIEATKRERAGMPLSALIRYVYRTYPESAVNSELTHLKA